jgi:hypothetical protein
MSLVGAERALALFFVQTPMASFSGHKPCRLCGNERRFADLSYAFRS